MSSSGAPYPDAAAPPAGPAPPPAPRCPGGGRSYTWPRGSATLPAGRYAAAPTKPAAAAASPGCNGGGGGGGGGPAAFRLALVAAARVGVAVQAIRAVLLVAVGELIAPLLAFDPAWEGRRKRRRGWRRRRVEGHAHPVLELAPAAAVGDGRFGRARAAPRAVAHVTRAMGAQPALGRQRLLAHRLGGRIGPIDVLRARALREALLGRGEGGREREQHQPQRPHHTVCSRLPLPPPAVPTFVSRCETCVKQHAFFHACHKQVGLARSPSNGEINIMLASLARRSASSTRLLRRAMSSSVPGESGTVAVNGVNIFYRKNGGSGLPILCMPGAMGKFCDPP